MYALERDNRMKKKIIVVLVAILSVFLLLSLISFFETNKKENLSILSKRMGYKNNEKMLQELKGKTIYTSEGKIFIDNKNTESSCSLNIEKGDKLYIEEIGIEKDKLIIKCSNEQKISLISLTEKEEKEIIKIINKNNNIDSTNESDNNNRNQTIQNEKKQCELVVSRKEAKSGNEVEIPVKIKNNPGILGMTIAIIYDDNALELKDVKNGEAFVNILQFTKPSKFYSGCTCLWDGIEIENKEIKDGVIATLVFELSDKASSKIYSIGIECNGNDVINNDLKKIDVKVNNGQIKVN